MIRTILKQGSWNFNIIKTGHPPDSNSSFDNYFSLQDKIGWLKHNSIAPVIQASYLTSLLSLWSKFWGENSSSFKRPQPHSEFTGVTECYFP